MNNRTTQSKILKRLEALTNSDRSDILEIFSTVESKPGVEKLLLGKDCSSWAKLEFKRILESKDLLGLYEALPIRGKTSHGEIRDCTRCGKSSEKVYFPKNSRKCRHCQNEIWAENREKGGQDPWAVRRKARQAAAAREMGLLKEGFDYDKMFSAQGGVCRVCGNPETKISRGVVRRLSVDHCHRQMRIRGLLCTACNTGLGQFKDSAELLRQAALYVEEFSGR